MTHEHNCGSLNQLWKRSRPGFSVCALALAVSQSALAQSSKPIGQLEEVIVTGTKREAQVQDVPISVSTVTSETLGRSQFNDIRALGQKAPGLVLSNPSGFNAAGGGMRGTGTNVILVTQDAPVSFLIDEFALSHVSSQFLNMFDIQQIEVYRGPQGTLFGKNATGGVISIQTKKPIIGESSGDIEATYGMYDGGSDGNFGSFKGAINIPINDTMAMRLSAIYDQDDGYYKDGKTTSTFPDNVPLWGLYGIPAGTPVDPSVNTNVRGTGKDLGGKDVMAAKAKFLWEPADNFSALFTYEYLRDRSDSPPGVNENSETDLLTLLGFPGNAQAGNSDPYNTLISHNPVISMDDGHKVDIDGYYLNMNWDVGHGTIKSITGYREEQQRFPSTYTGEAFQSLFDATRDTKRETFQQEFRYVSQFDGPFNFSSGVSYYKDSLDMFALKMVGLISLIPVFDPETGSFVNSDGYVNLDTRALNDWDYEGTKQDREEFGFYWDGTWEFDEQWSATFGFRYSHDEKDFLRYIGGGAPCNEYTEAQDAITVDGECRDVRSMFLSRGGFTPDQYNGTVMIPLEQFGTQVRRSDTWEEMTYRAVLNYKPADDILVYLSYATGFLSGGFSETCATPSRCSYDPETNENIELGIKSDLFDNTLRLNAAVYQTTYEDLQRAVVAIYTAADGSSQQETVTVNTGESELWGLDLEATWVPTPSISISASVNWLDHEYEEGILPDLRGTNDPVDLTQFNVPYSPDLKAMLSVDYQINTKHGSYILTASANYQDEAETDVFNSVNTQMESRTLVDLSVTYEAGNSPWSLSFFAANITEEEYRIAALPVAGLWNFTNYGAPRSFGMKFKYHFGE